MNYNPKAFPSGSRYSGDLGMTLRDWFAGQALVAMGLWHPYREDGSAVSDHAEVQSVRSQYAYQTADAMLEARKAKP